MDRRLSQIATLSGLVGLIIPIGGIVAAYYPGFTWVNNDISDFGLYNQIFNWCLIISGIFMGIFILTSSKLTEIQIGLLPRSFLLLASAALSFLGIFPKNTPYSLHYIVAYIMFFLFPAALLLIWKNIKHHSTEAANFTAVILITFLFIWFIYYLLRLIYGKLGLAIPETMSLILAMVWICAFIIKYIHKINN